MLAFSQYVFHVRELNYSAVFAGVFFKSTVIQGQFTACDLFISQQPSYLAALAFVVYGYCYRINQLSSYTYINMNRQQHCSRTRRVSFTLPDLHKRGRMPQAKLIEILLIKTNYGGITFQVLIKLKHFRAVPEADSFIDGDAQ